jgi:pimeloyl-ACP methyl ester carboxylesterase
MPTLTSADGTTIAYERVGIGPALVLVDGAMCYRGAGPTGPLAALLQDTFTVYTYDRRGRGESTDTMPYAVAREVEDLQALIAKAGGEAYVYAISSGAALALATAAAGPGITKMALFEPPFMAEVEDGLRIKEYTERLHELLEGGHRGDAVALFMTYVGMPAQVVAGIRSQPGWPALEAIAPTLAYDDDLLDGGRVPRDVTSTITAPAAVLSGGASPQGLQGAAEATVAALPTGEHRTLADQTHDAAPEAVAPVLIEFFGSTARG